MKLNTNSAVGYAISVLTGLASLLLMATSAQAQTQPNRLTTPSKPDLNSLLKEELPVQAAQGLDADKPTIFVKTSKLTGPVIAFTPAHLQTALAGFVNRPLSLTELQFAACGD